MNKKVPDFVVTVLDKPVDGKSIGVLVGANYIEVLKAKGVKLWRCKIINNRTPKRFICQLELGTLIFMYSCVFYV